MNKLIKIEDMDSTVMTAFRQIVREELMPIKDILDDHTRILDDHTRILDDHTRILYSHTRLLDEHTEKLNALTGEVMILQEQTKSIYDGLALGDSRNKREIDEIKYHLGLKPLDPL